MDTLCLVPLDYEYQGLTSQTIYPAPIYHREDSCLIDNIVAIPAKSYVVDRNCNKRKFQQENDYEPAVKKYQKVMHRQIRHPSKSRRRRVNQQQPEDQQLQQQQAPSSSAQNSTVNCLENELRHLRDEWATIDIVLTSVRNALNFTIQPIETASEEHLDDIDRELAIAYDDLLAQVRHLDRNLKRLNEVMDPLREAARTTTSSNQAPSTPFPVETSAPPQHSSRNTSLKWSKKVRVKSPDPFPPRF